MSCLRWLLSIPLPGEKTKDTRGAQLFFGCLENVSGAGRAPSILPNIKIYVDAIKAKEKTIRANKKKFKELECILRVKLITARLYFFLLISREVEPFLKIYQSDKPMTALISYDLSSLIRSLM